MCSWQIEMDVWQCGLLPTLASSSSNSHVCFVALEFFWVDLLPVSTPEKDKTPKSCKALLVMSKLKLTIQKKSNHPKKSKMHLHFMCWTFPREMKSNWKVFEALRCFASSTLSEEAMPVTSVASSTGWWSIWNLAFRHSPWFVWYVSTCLPTACYIVIWFAKCITNQLPLLFFQTMIQQQR